MFTMNLTMVRRGSFLRSIRPPLAGVNVLPHRLHRYLGRPLLALPHRIASPDLPHFGQAGSGLASAIRASSWAGLSWNLAYSPSFSALINASLLFFGSAKTPHLLVWKDLRSGMRFSSGFQVAAAEVFGRQTGPKRRRPREIYLGCESDLARPLYAEAKTGSKITNTMHDSHFFF
jgi:hypothetical protein